MKLESVANASSVAEAGLKQEVSFAVLKKAMQVEGDSVVQLLDAAKPANLPAHLGNTINTTA